MVSVVNGFGESNVLYGIAVVNTLLNDQLQIKITTALRAWVLALAGTAVVTGWNLYVADVATGTAQPGSRHRSGCPSADPKAGRP